MSNPDSSEKGATRKPDASIALANVRCSGWHAGHKGWSFMVSRSYRDQAGETRYSQMAVYGRDLLNLAAVCQAMAQHVMNVCTNGEEERSMK